MISSPYAFTRCGRCDQPFDAALYAATCPKCGYDGDGTETHATFPPFPRFTDAPGARLSDRGGLVLQFVVACDIVPIDLPGEVYRAALHVALCSLHGRTGDDPMITRVTHAMRRIEGMLDRVERATADLASVAPVPAVTPVPPASDDDRGRLAPLQPKPFNRPPSGQKVEIPF